MPKEDVMFDEILAAPWRCARRPMIGHNADDVAAPLASGDLIGGLDHRAQMVERIGCLGHVFGSHGMLGGPRHIWLAVRAVLPG